MPQDMKSRKVPSKLCLRCNRILPLTDFYTNKGWRDQTYRDAWCKECVGKYCKDKETLRTYCFENNRKWEDSFWDSSMKKAQYYVSTDPEYLKTTSPTKKDSIAKGAACRCFFSMMNMKGIYQFVNNIDAPDTQTDVDTGMPTEKTLQYSKKWRGRFTAEQIAELEATYANYEEDFVLDNENLRDYAKKVAKASLNADIAEDRMRRGEGTASEYREAQKIFDDLSKSSNFAACKRKPGESSGLGSLGEIILRIEVTGALNVSGVTFPEDDVDKILKDFRHTIVAVGAEGRF